MPMGSAQQPLPLAGWRPVGSTANFGDRFELRPLPDGVLPPDPDHEWAARDAARRSDANDVFAMMEAGALYVTVSAAHIVRRRPQEAVDAVAAANAHFSRYAAIFPTTVTGWIRTRWAAAWYNAALTYWYCEQDDACIDMLERAEGQLSQVEAKYRDDPDVQVVASSLAKLRALVA